MIFWLETRKNKKTRKIFFKNFFHFWEKINFTKIEISQNMFSYFHEIQNLSSQKALFLGPQTSASSSDLFG